MTDGPLRQQDPRFVRDMFSSIAGRYDLANHLLSGGLDFLWRRELAARVAESEPRTILDLATGSGDLALALARANPRAQIIGADFCLPMLEQARLKGVPHLVQADGLQLPFADATFDAVTVAFGLRNMADWARALREMARVLRPGGRVFVLDFAMPRPEFLARAYRLYLHNLLPRIAGWLTRRPEAYEYLGESIEKFPRWEGMSRLLNDCGFHHVHTRAHTFGIVARYEGVRSELL